MNLVTAPNFRELGGLHTQNGGRVRQGLLYRSEALDRLSDADMAILQPLKVRVVCDLRTAHERESFPHRLPADWQPEILTAGAGIDAGAADLSRGYRKELYSNLAVVRSYMVQTYGAFPAQFAPVLTELFQRLIDGRQPVLINCAVGKDRTGFVCAMLLHALGAAPETIFADYLLSDRFYGFARIAETLKQRVGVTPPSEMVDLLRVRHEYLESAITVIEKQYGSADVYLESQAGLNASRRDTLRERLIQNAADTS